MILYHFTTSPYARRVRLALAHKGISVELRDARANPEHGAELKKLNPFHTVPVLVDGERVIADSMAISQHVDRKVPKPALFDDPETFELVALCDSAINVLVDLGLRYHPLHTHEKFAEVRAEYVGRSQRALDRLGERMSARGDGWGYGEMAAFTMITWLEGLPARAKTFPLAKQVLDLGWSMPPALGAWAARHRTRPEVVALG